MYELKTLCLFSIWAGQSLRKYVLSRRAATDWTAAHVVSMAAFSSVFSFSLHRNSHISVFTNSLMLGLRLQTKRESIPEWFEVLWDLFFFMHSSSKIKKKKRMQENYNNDKYACVELHRLSVHIVNQFTRIRNLVQILGDFWSTPCISLQTQTPKY